MATYFYNFALDPNDDCEPCACTEVSTACSGCAPTGVPPQYCQDQVSFLHHGYYPSNTYENPETVLADLSGIAPNGFTVISIGQARLNLRNGMVSVAVCYQPTE